MSKLTAVAYYGGIPPYNNNPENMYLYLNKSYIINKNNPYTLNLLGLYYHNHIKDYYSAEKYYLLSYNLNY